jgi:hypothetical protein
MGQQAGAPGHATTYADGAGVIRFHVVSLSPSGFVVVAADDEVEPILAFSCGGEFVAPRRAIRFTICCCATRMCGPGRRRFFKPEGVARWAGRMRSGSF